LDQEWGKDAAAGLLSSNANATRSEPPLFELFLNQVGAQHFTHSLRWSVSSNGTKRADERVRFRGYSNQACNINMFADKCNEGVTI